MFIQYTIGNDICFISLQQIHCIRYTPVPKGKQKVFIYGPTLPVPVAHTVNEDGSTTEIFGNVIIDTLEFDTQKLAEKFLVAIADKLGCIKIQTRTGATIDQSLIDAIKIIR